MLWLHWLIVALSTCLGAWMAFDGIRALTLGDYTTPLSGPHKGDLGVWSRLVEGIGVKARGVPMKSAFVLFGTLWLAAAVTTLLGFEWASMLVVVLGAATLWYAPVGTVLAVVLIGLSAWSLVTG